MKRFFQIMWMACLFVFTIALSSCSVSKHSAKSKGMARLPEPAILFSTLDSIVDEAWQLYYSERVNWIASDILMGSHSADEVGGSVSWQSSDSVWSAVFFDKERKNTIVQYHYNFLSGKSTIVDSTQEATPEQLSEFKRRKKIIENGVNMYGDQLFFADESFGSPNIDIIRINDTLTRLYLLQGTIVNDIIPFGNDYSIDFDEDLNPIAFRKYHSSLIATPTRTENGGKVKVIMHSHLKDNPFITPTDICNFLLYHPEGEDMFFVYSTAYKCKFAYSLKFNKIITVTD